MGGSKISGWSEAKIWAHKYRQGRRCGPNSICGTVIILQGWEEDRANIKKSKRYLSIVLESRFKRGTEYWDWSIYDLEWPSCSMLWIPPTRLRGYWCMYAQFTLSSYLHCWQTRSWAKNGKRGEEKKKKTLQPVYAVSLPGAEILFADTVCWVSLILSRIPIIEFPPLSGRVSRHAGII